MHVDLKIVPCAADTPAQEALSLGLIDSPVENSRALGELTTNVYIGQLHVVGVTGQDHALNELVRILVNDLSVLERARLGFVGIADKINRLAGLAVDKVPFQATREPRAAPAAQTGRKHLATDRFLRRHDDTPGLLRLEPENLF